jgi:serine/threonine protein kinase
LLRDFSLAGKLNRELSIDTFNLAEGRILARKYEVVSKLGSGWEGEVYKIRELNTGVERAAKLFFPHRNLRNKTSKFYAIKLHQLRHCSIVIQYHTEEQIIYRKTPITVLISEYVEGELFSSFLKKQPRKRLNPFQSLHLLHALTKGIEEIHNLREYHGDLHPENIIVRRYGLSFDLKLLDMFHWSTPKKQNIQDDICDLIRIFYDALGGAKRYSQQPLQVKAICCGLKRSLILKKFKTTKQLREHLETMKWTSS